MNNFVEIVCPNCGHRFVWLEHSWPNCHFYHRKGYDDEFLESTSCPKCGMEMVVLKEIHSGMDIYDESIERINIHTV